MLTRMAHEHCPSDVMKNTHTCPTLWQGTGVMAFRAGTNCPLKTFAFTREDVSWTPASLL